MKGTCKSLYLGSVTIILFGIGLIKLISAFGESSILKMSDPLFYFLSTREIYALAGLSEIAVALVIVSAAPVLVKLNAIIILSSGIIGYRWTLHLVHPGVPCPCLGSALGWLKISQPMADIWLTAIVTYMFTVGYMLLLKRWCSKPNTVSKESAN